MDTLTDILESLGTDLKNFFSDFTDEKVVFSDADMSVKEDGEAMKGFIKWLVPSAQKNRMEPILIEMAPGGETEEDDPHEGEEFGYVLAGNIKIILGDRVIRARRDDQLLFPAHGAPPDCQRGQKRLPGDLGVHAAELLIINRKIFCKKGIGPCTTRCG